jgi:lauroyl/myristoyl acyltransferase
MKNEKGSVPVRYWAMWWALIVLADFIFYVVLTPIWIGLRVVAWLAEFRSRRRRSTD